MITDLVTVTYDMDFEYMLLQAESIKKYLEPCTHWVVINEEGEIDLSKYFNSLKKYYVSHKLKLLKQSDLFNNSNDKHGHYTQQICKLEIAKIIRRDYLILDSKNFFIKPVSLNHWDNIVGCNLFMDLPEGFWHNTIQTYCERLNVTAPGGMVMPSTPYKIKITENLLNTTDYYTKISIENFGAASEFIYYFLDNQNLFDLENIIHTNSFQHFYTYFHHHFEETTTDLYSHIKERDELPKFKVLGFHKKFLEKCQPEHIHIINNWLKEKNFEFQYQLNI